MYGIKYKISVTWGAQGRVSNTVAISTKWWLLHHFQLKYLLEGPLKEFNSLEPDVFDKRGRVLYVVLVIVPYYIALRKYVFEKLSKTPGWKVLIMDDAATRVLSSCFKMQDITEYGVTRKFVYSLCNYWMCSCRISKLQASKTKYACNIYHEAPKSSKSVGLCNFSQGNRIAFTRLSWIKSNLFRCACFLFVL